MEAALPASAELAAEAELARSWPSEKIFLQNL